MSLGFRAFQIGAPRLFNKLQVNVRDSSNLDIFKKRLKTFYFDECYDVFEETLNEYYRVEADTLSQVRASYTNEGYIESGVEPRGMWPERLQAHKLTFFPSIC